MTEGKQPDASKTPGDRDKEPEQSKTPPETGALDRVLASFEEFVAAITSQAANAAPPGELKTLIATTGQSLSEQNNRLITHIRESAQRLSPVQLRELDAFLNVQNGEALAKRAIGTTRDVLAQGASRSFLSWLAEFFTQIKKILKKILQLIFDLLGIKWPSWLDLIFDILDELFHLLLSLLGEVFGFDFRTTARILSELEVNFLHEQAALESVRAAQMGRSFGVEEA
jgi:hypothetical protein